MNREAEAYEFVMNFVEASKRYKDQYIGTWQEVLDNYMVRPYDGIGRNGVSPFARPNDRRYSSSHRVILKDPETHKAISTYGAKLMRALFGDTRKEYIKARPVGYEDAPQKAPTTTRLLRYAFGLPGHFRTMTEAIFDMLLFGTAVIEVGWKYEEREMPVREVTSTYGVEEDRFTRMVVPVYDDVILRVVDIHDFFPDPSQYRIHDMNGVAKRFKMTPIQARAMATGEIYDNAQVEKAISHGVKGEAPRGEQSFRSGVDQPENHTQCGPFDEMIGYEYWGDVPWEDDQGSSRRVITVLNNVVVRNDPSPYADYCLPFHTFIINPVHGRFYGVSPGEVIRYDQDFADVLKMLVAEAVIRQVHPPIAIDPDADVDVQALRAWKTDAVIAARGGPNAIGTLRYDANAPNGFAMLSALKESMQEASGALGGIQGEPGPDREAATVGAARMQFAMDRPELAASLIENECLPPIGRSILRRYQQFLDSEGLALRVGEQPQSVWIGDIMGEYDIEFVGSRQEMTRQQKLQAYDRLISMANAIPPFAAMVPWQMIAQRLIGDELQLPEVAASIGDPNTIMANMLLQQASGPGGAASNGNGAVMSPQEPGMLPAQAGGGPVGV